MMQTTLTEKANALAELAVAFEYPTADYIRSVLRWISTYKACFPVAAQTLQSFADAIAEYSTENLEEAYTRTFDMAPICSPYISGHIYGDENFERGTLLTALSERYNQASFSTGGELPDHLAVIMRFAPNMTEEELEELSEYCLSKPLDEMIKSLSGNPYEHAMRAVSQLLHVDGARK
jgi:nitrate reductase delta subunit